MFLVNIFSKSFGWDLENNIDFFFFFFSEKYIPSMIGNRIDPTIKKKETPQKPTTWMETEGRNFFRGGKRKMARGYSARNGSIVWMGHGDGEWQAEKGGAG